MNSQTPKSIVEREIYTLEISLKPLVRGEERSVCFSYEIPLDYSENGYKLSGNASVNGKICDMGGYMRLEAQCSASYKTRCARCLKELDGELVKDFNRSVALTLESEDDGEEYLIANENTVVDIDEALKEELCLSLPLRVLCKEDCKGLCIKCGCNKNEKECSCVTTELDPRWAVLKNFKAKE